MSTWDKEQFLEILKDALAHLYDFAYLRTHPLLDVLSPDQSQSTMDRVLRLRQRLQQGIERLSPGSQIPAAAKEWRPYLALRYHYVDCLDLQQVERRIGLGDRQLLRERNRGVEALAALLWEEIITPSPAGIADQTPPPAGMMSAASVSSELSALGVEYTEISICGILDKARQSVAGLSSQHGIEIECTPVDEHLVVLADATLLRQTLIACLSHAITSSKAGPISIQARLADHRVSISIQWMGALDEQATSLAAITALVEAQKGQVDMARTDDVATLTLIIPQARISSVLVIEDNASLQQLYSRYLDPDHYRVLQAETSKVGLELARAEMPDVIVLDVMMRGMDGWEVLQRLRAQPETATIPVIVSSVLPEKELALSLGADAFLPKPVSRFDLLDAIQACLRLPRNVARPHPAEP